MTKQVSVTVSAPAYDLGQGVRAFLTATRKALADGWQPGSDIPAVLVAVYADLIPQIQNVSAAVADAKSDTRDFVRAFGECAEDIASDFLS